MENIQLSRKADSVKDDITDIIDEFISEIETLESEKLDLQSKIDTLELRIQELSE